jgi:hypothetical protein
MEGSLAIDKVAQYTSDKRVPSGKFWARAMGSIPDGQYPPDGQDSPDGQYTPDGPTDFHNQNTWSSSWT